MKIYYISPSEMPSRTANSIHVVRMCEAFASMGHDVTMVVDRSVPDSNGLRELLEDYYGVKLKNVTVVSFYKGNISIAINLLIAIQSVVVYLLNMIKGKTPDIIVSRNLYASFFFSWFAKSKILFETHELEYGFRKWIQGSIIKHKTLKKVIISKALNQLLAEHHGQAIQRSIILHDAAPAGVERLLPDQRLTLRNEILTDLNLNSYVHIAGYFGHLYQGRGIEIIQELAASHPKTAFLVYGGNKDQIALYLKQNKLKNIMIMGHVEPANVLKIMCIMDVLLMPYQSNVSVGGKNRSDTARYMSPIKMFEYMAVGVPIIASKLPVLEEILTDRVNCLLATPNDPSSWSNCLKLLFSDKELSETLGKTAHNDYKRFYTWNLRAQRMLNIASYKD